MELDGMLLPSITPTVLDRIPPGRHELRAWIDPKETWVVRFRLYPGQKRTLQGSLPKPGALSIEVEIEPESEPSEPGDEEIVPKESEKKELGDKTVP